MHTYFRVKLDDSNLIDGCHGWAHNNATEDGRLQHVEMLRARSFAGCMLEGGGAEVKSNCGEDGPFANPNIAQNPQAKRLNKILTDHLPTITPNHGAQYTTGSV